MKKSHKKILVIIVSFIVGFWAIYRCSRPKLTLKSNEIKTYSFSNDTRKNDTLLPDRHCGWINLKKFIEFADKKGAVKTSPLQDSITISIDIDNLFGLDNGNKWRKKYKNLPVRFPDDNSFTAEIKNENDTAYIYIPYQILSKLAAVKSQSQTSDKKQVNKVQQTSKPKADGKKSSKRGKRRRNR